MYILGAAAVPALGWAVHVTNVLRSISKESNELIKMHREPDNTGFGIAPLVPMISANTKALGELTSSIREQTIWMKANRS